MPDFLFPEMSDSSYAAPGWKPNQTAFSPTETMPLTARVKALMGVQGFAALITTAVIVARAVNLLG